MSKAGKRLLAAAAEAVAIARGDKKPARVHIPADIDVKAIRQKTGMSQDDFAIHYCFTVDQIKAWEQGRTRPLGGSRAYLMLIDIDPKGVLEMLAKATKMSKAA